MKTQAEASLKGAGASFLTLGKEAMTAAEMVKAGQGAPRPDAIMLPGEQFLKEKWGEAKQYLSDTADTLGKEAADATTIAKAQKGFGQQATRLATGFVVGGVPGIAHFAAEYGSKPISFLIGAARTKEEREAQGLPESGAEEIWGGIKNTVYGSIMKGALHHLGQIKKVYSVPMAAGLGATDYAFQTKAQGGQIDAADLGEAAGTMAGFRALQGITKKGRIHAPGNLTPLEAVRGGIYDNKIRLKTLFDPEFQDNIQNYDPFVRQMMESNNADVIPAIFDEAYKWELNKYRKLHESTGGEVTFRQFGENPDDLAVKVQKNLAPDRPEFATETPLIAFRAKALASIAERIKTAENIDPAGKAYLQEALRNIYGNVRDQYIYKMSKLQAIKALKIASGRDYQPAYLNAFIGDMTQMNIRKILKPLADELKIPDDVIKFYSAYRASQILYVNSVGKEASPHDQAIRQGKMEAARKAYRNILSERFKMSEQEAESMDKAMDTVISATLTEQIGGGVDKLGNLIESIREESAPAKLAAKRAGQAKEIIAGQLTLPKQFMAETHYRPSPKIIEKIMKYKEQEAIVKEMVPQTTDLSYNTRAAQKLGILKDSILNEIRKEFNRGFKQNLRGNPEEWNRYIQSAKNAQKGYVLGGQLAAKHLWDYAMRMTPEDLRFLSTPEEAKGTPKPHRLSPEIIKEAPDGLDRAGTSKALMNASAKLLNSYDVYSHSSEIMEWLKTGDDFAYQDLMHQNPKAMEKYTRGVQELVRAAFGWGDKTWIWLNKDDVVSGDKVFLRGTFDENKANTQRETVPISEVRGINPMTGEVLIWNYGIRDKEAARNERAARRERNERYKAAKEKVAKMSDVSDRPGSPAIQVLDADGKPHLFTKEINTETGIETTHGDMAKSATAFVKQLEQLGEPAKKVRIGWMVDGFFIEDPATKSAQKAADTSKPKKEKKPKAPSQGASQTPSSALKPPPVIPPTKAEAATAQTKPASEPTPPPSLEKSAATDKTKVFEDAIRQTQKLMGGASRSQAIEQIEYNDELWQQIEKQGGVTRQDWQDFRMGKKTETTDARIKGLAYDVVSLKMPHLDNNYMSVIKNPDKNKLRSMAEAFKEVRIVYDKDGNIYAWDSSYATHQQIINALKKIGVSAENSKHDFVFGAAEVDASMGIDNIKYRGVNPNLESDINEIFNKVKRRNVYEMARSGDPSSLSQEYFNYLAELNEEANSATGFRERQRVQDYAGNEAIRSLLSNSVFKNDADLYGHILNSTIDPRTTETLYAKYKDSIEADNDSFRWIMNKTELDRNIRTLFNINPDGSTSWKKTTDILKAYREELNGKDLDPEEFAISMVLDKLLSSSAVTDSIIPSTEMWHLRTYFGPYAFSNYTGRLYRKTSNNFSVDPWASRDQFIVVDPFVSPENLRTVIIHEAVHSATLTHESMTPKNDKAKMALLKVAQMAYENLDDVNKNTYGFSGLRRYLEALHNTNKDIQGVNEESTELLRAHQESKIRDLEDKVFVEFVAEGMANPYFMMALKNVKLSREQVLELEGLDSYGNFIAYHGHGDSIGGKLIAKSFDVESNPFLHKMLYNVGNAYEYMRYLIAKGMNIANTQEMTALEIVLKRGADLFEENARLEGLAKERKKEILAGKRPDPDSLRASGDAEFSQKLDKAKTEISDAGFGNNGTNRGARIDDFEEWSRAKMLAIEKFDPKDASALDLVLTMNHVADRHPDIAPILNRVMDEHANYTHRINSYEERITTLFKEAEKIYRKEKRNLIGHPIESMKNINASIGDWIFGKSGTILGDAGKWVTGEKSYPASMEGFVLELRKINKEIHKVITQEKKKQFFNHQPKAAKALFIELKNAGWDYDTLKNIPETYGTPRSREGVKDIVEKFEEIDKWGQDPEKYFPEAFGGKYKIINQRTGKIAASGTTPKQAYERLRENIDEGRFMHTEGDSYTMTHSLYEMMDAKKNIVENMDRDQRAEYWDDLSNRATYDQFALKLPRKTYIRLMSRLKNNVDKNINDFLSVATDTLVDSGTAESLSQLMKGAGKLDLRRIIKPEPNPKFWAHMLKKATNLKGDEVDPFVVYSRYVQGLQKKLSVDAVSKDVIKAIEALPESAQRKKAILAQQFQTFAGDYTWDNKLADGIIASIGSSKLMNTLTGGLAEKVMSLPAFAKPFFMSRFVGKLSAAEAFGKLGYAPVKALINYYGGSMHTIVKEGGGWWLKGKKFLYTDEGKKLIDEIGHKAGMEMLYSATGRENYVSSRGSVFRPLGLYNKMETGLTGKHKMKYQFGTRPEALAASYLKAMQETGGNVEQSKQIAIDSARLTQFMYMTTAYPYWVNKAGVGRGAYQFKQYLMSEIRFLRHLKPAQMAVYLGHIGIMAGTKGLWLMTKSILPIMLLGAGVKQVIQLANSDDTRLPSAIDVDKWMDDNLPDVITRGIPGLLGIDLSAPMTWQLPQTARDIFGPGFSDLSKAMEAATKWPLTAEEKEEYFRSTLTVAYNIYRGVEIARDLSENADRIPIRMGNNTIEYVDRDEAGKRMVSNFMAVKDIDEAKEQTNAAWLRQKDEEFTRRRQVLIDRLLNADTYEDKKKILEIMQKGGYYDPQAVRQTLSNQLQTRELRQLKRAPKPIQYEYLKQRMENNAERRQ